MTTDNNVKYGNIFASALYSELKGFISDTDTDLMINEDGTVWIQNKEGEINCVKKGFDNSKIMPLAGLLASHYGLTINGKHPFLDCSIPFDGSRVHIQIPPSTEAPTLSLRFHRKVFRSLDTLCKNGLMSEEEKQRLITYVKQKKNIIINGETGSGKTTLLSALINEIDPKERVVCIEDTKEITTTLPNITHSYTHDKEIFSDIEAVQSALRQNPHRIIYGEVRDGRATLELIKAWNTGHRGGMCTIHANTHKNDYIGGVKTRLKSLCGEVSQSSQEEAINEVLEVVVQIEIVNGVRKIVNIQNVKEDKS